MSVWQPRDRMEIEDSYGQHILIITESDANWISGNSTMKNDLENEVNKKDKKL